MDQKTKRETMTNSVAQFISTYILLPLFVAGAIVVIRPDNLSQFWQLFVAMVLATVALLYAVDAITWAICYRLKKEGR